MAWNDILFLLTFSTLEEDDVQYLMKELVEVMDKWKLIGVALGLKPSKIKVIDEENHSNIANCFMDTLTSWLNRNYNTAKFGEPSWHKLVEAVASPAGGNNKVLAESIASRHQCKLISLMNIRRSKFIEVYDNFSQGRISYINV